MFLWKAGLGHSSGQGVSNSMGFRKDGDCITDLTCVTCEIHGPGVDPCCRKWAAHCAHGLAKQWDEFAEENLSRAVRKTLI